MRQRKAGNILLLFGLIVMALGFMANTASATDEGPNYQDKVVKIEGSRSFDGTNTTFTFNAQFSEPVSHLVVVSCPESINVVDATAPAGVTVEKNKADPSTGHTGAKFEKAGGTPGGTYTVTFTGDVTGAEFIVKNGNGHKHYSIGTGCSANSTVSTTATTASSTTTTTAPTTTTTAPTTTTTAPTTTTTESTTTTEAPSSSTTTTTSLLPDILGETTTTTEAPSSTTATTAAQNSESTTTTTLDSSVLGSQLEKPSEQLQPAPSVEGVNETQDATIPRTGSGTGDYLLLAGIAFILGGLAVRFGQPEGATPA